MSSRATRDHPSPILSADDVRTLLVERNAEIGAEGGRAGAELIAHIPGVNPDDVASAGRFGGRLGAKLFTRVMGAGARVPAPYRREGLDELSSLMFRVFVAEELPAQEAGPSTARARMVAMMGAGWADANTAVIQLMWFPDRAEVTAHALEGLVNQRSAPKALAELERRLLAGPR